MSNLQSVTPSGPVDHGTTVPARIARRIKREYVGTGNVISSLQFSSYIRPSSETRCNDAEFAPGHLQQFDLKPFRGYAQRCPFVSSAISSAAHWADSIGTSVVFYLWRAQWGENQSPVIYGATIADSSGAIIWRGASMYRYGATVSALESAAGLH